ncbi:DUF6634 family protein [Sinorhizobium sp. NFACC03]|uniref:DUF6634 family protein n=1 Tax=Sinorhizobium sp. NFACC03 TaxID=1566295 RepID=UPI00088B8C4C|nr:hypothetical protein SAMN03159448_03799 [Sinorhizobium sp. NFACC03]
MSYDDSAWRVMSRLTLAADLRRLADDLENAAPAPAASSSAVMINSWMRTTREVPCLVGRVLGHPILDDHSLIQTSELFYIDERGEFARTRSRWYRLGTHGAMSSGGSVKAN